MRKLIASVAVLFVAAISAEAQDEYPSVEIFGGFSYFNADLPDRDGLYGWGVSVAGNLNKRFGIVVESTGSYGHVTAPTIRIGELGRPFPVIIFPLKTEVSIHTFLVGPRVSFRSDRLTAFGHLLVGGARKQAAPDFGVIGLFDPRLFSDTGFAGAAGGGLDVKASRRVAVRLFQVDYMPIRFNDEWTHNLRVQSGIVFRFGGR